MIEYKGMQRLSLRLMTDGKNSNYFLISDINTADNFHKNLTRTVV